MTVLTHQVRLGGGRGHRTTHKREKEVLSQVFRDDSIQVILHELKEPLIVHGLAESHKYSHILYTFKTQKQEDLIATLGYECISTFFILN